jgi:hypothetical protein
MGRIARRCKQTLNGVKEMRGYWKLEKEAPDHTLWRTYFGRDSGPTVRQTTEWKNKYPISPKSIHYK